MKKVTVALKCPSCASPLTIREGDTHIVCSSCGSSLFLPDAIQKYVLPSATTGIDVLRSVRRELKKINPEEVGKVQVSRPKLYYVPFWHCNAQVNGYVLGIEPKYEEREIVVTDSDSQSSSGYSVTVTRKVKSRTGAEAVEREIQLAGSVNVSAANLEPLGIPTLSGDSQLSLQGLAIQRNALPEGLEVLEDETSRDGVFVDPVVTVADARSQAATYLARLGSGVGYGLEEKWEYSIVSGHRDALVYYPIWITDFRSGGSSYQVVVDGRSGDILRGRFPSSGKDRKIISVAAGLFWAGILPFIVDTVINGKLNYQSHSGQRSSCLPVLLLIVGALAYGTWHLLKILRGLSGRRGEHVIY